MNLRNIRITTTDRIEASEQRVKQAEYEAARSKFDAQIAKSESLKLKHLLSEKYGQEIIDQAKEQLAMGLTREMEDILQVMRQRILFSVHQSDRPDKMARHIDFEINIPTVRLRFSHQVSMRDMADYHLYKD